MNTSDTDRPIRSIKWKRPGADSFSDITDAIEEGVVSATLHPDESIDRPKGYSVRLVLKDESTELAEELQQALLDMEPSTLVVRLEGEETPVDIPVSVSKVPYPGEQNIAEMGVPPEGHDTLHEYFGG